MTSGMGGGTEGVGNLLASAGLPEPVGRLRSREQH